jgi:hypothetical protein
LEVASQVPPDKAATTEQYRKAALAFAKLLDILDPYLAVPDEGRLVAKALRSLEFPPWVLNWDYELTRDHADEPAVILTIFVDEKAAAPMDYARMASRMTRPIQHALADLGVNRYPYLRMRTAFEHKSM